MTDRIDGSPSPHIPRTDETTESESADQTGEAESTATPQRSEQSSATEHPGQRDVWEDASMASEDDLIDRMATDGEAPPPSGDIDPDEAMAAWEMAASIRSDMVEEATAQADDPAEVEGQAGGENNGENDGFAVEDSFVAANLSNALARMEEQDVRSGELGMYLNGHVFDNLRGSGRAELVELANHSSEFHDHLVETHGDVEMADAYVEQIQSQVVGLASDQIANRAREPIQSGMEAVDNINHNTESRRGFLVQTVEQADDRQSIHDALTDFGIAPSAAEDLAEDLEALRTDDVARQEFLSGAEGETGFLGIGGGEYDQIEEQLADELESMRQGLDSLESSLTRDQIQHDRIFTNPTLAPIRDEVLDEMGAVTEPASEVNELGALFNETIADSESAQSRERGMQFVIGLGAGAAASVGTGGLGAGAAAAAVGATTAGAQAIPDVAQARQDVDMAQASVNTDLASPELVEMAERDEKVAYALATASILGGGASGMVKNDVGSAVADQAIGSGADGYDAANQ